VSYRAALEEMTALWARRRAGEIPDTLMLLEHPPVLTVGRSRAEGDILTSRERLAALGFEVHEIDRGGRVTYHGPGQLVAYPIFAIGTSPLAAARFVFRLSKVMLRLLRDYGIEGRWDAECPGTWVGDAKVGSIGVRVEAGVSRHGFAFNVDPDLAHFGHIVACGIRDRGQTSLARLTGRPIGVAEVAARAPAAFSEVFRAAAEPWS
jgi:lipoate-protein ligase B